MKKTPTKTNKAQPKTRVPKKITARYLYNSGLYYLKRFPASVAHFQNVMMRKIRKSCQAHPDQDLKACQDLLEDTTQKFIDLGLLNDELYTRGMVRSLRQSGKSKRAIMARMATKGIPRDLVQDHLTRYEDERQDQSNSAEWDAALTFARKRRIGPYAVNKVNRGQEHETHRKALAKMARAGFSYDIAQRVLSTEPE